MAAQQIRNRRSKCFVYLRLVGADADRLAASNVSKINVPPGYGRATIQGPEPA